MKKSIFILTLAFSVNVFGTSEVEALKKRIAALEALSGQSKSAPGIKVKNLDGEKIEESSRGLATAGGGPSVSAEQLADIKKKLEDFKVRRMEEMKYLEELDKEEY